jgi:hypothetical protein
LLNQHKDFFATTGEEYIDEDIQMLNEEPKQVDREREQIEKRREKHLM